MVSMTIMIAATMMLSIKEKPFSRPFVFLMPCFQSAQQHFAMTLTMEPACVSRSLRSPACLAPKAFLGFFETGYTRSAYAYSYLTDKSFFWLATTGQKDGFRAVEADPYRSSRWTVTEVCKIGVDRRFVLAPGRGYLNHFVGMGLGRSVPSMNRPRRDAMPMASLSLRPGSSKHRSTFWCYRSRTKFGPRSTSLNAALRSRTTGVPSPLVSQALIKPNVSVP